MLDRDARALAKSPAATSGREATPGAPSHRVVELQRQIGNRAVGGLLQRNGYKYATESPHYSSSRDEAHSSGKAALLAAEGENETVSRKIYGKHKSTGHSGKLVTTFKTSSGGYLVVVTYANLAKGGLTYDTAFFSRQPPAAPESTAKSFNPESPVIQV